MNDTDKYRNDKFPSIKLREKQAAMGTILSLKAIMPILLSLTAVSIVVVLDIIWVIKVANSMCHDVKKSG